MAGGAGDVSSWAGLQKQPAATRDAIITELQKIRESGKTSVTILLLGKSGVGKSSLVNTLVGDRVRPTNPFQPEVVQAVEVKQSYQGLELCIVDTPGLLEGGDISQAVLKNIFQFLLGRTVDVLVYVDRLDAYKLDTTDELIIRAITKSLGKPVWNSAIVVLTRSFMTPSDGRSYSEFAEARAEAMQSFIRKEAGLSGSHQIPVLRVENVATRCRPNEAGDKTLPDGSVFLPLLFKAIADLAVYRCKKAVVTQRTVDGPDANQRHKVLIPLVLLAQAFFVFIPLERAIQQDKKDERRNRPKWEVEAEEHRRLSAARMARKS